MNFCTNVTINNCINFDNRDYYRVITDGSRPWYEIACHHNTEDLEHIEFSEFSYPKTIPIQRNFTPAIEFIYPDENGKVTIFRRYLALQDSCIEE
jgi:hypothetical protein